MIKLGWCIGFRWWLEMFCSWARCIESGFILCGDISDNELQPRPSLRSIGDYERCLMIPVCAIGQTGNVNPVYVIPSDEWRGQLEQQIGSSKFGILHWPRCTHFFSPCGLL